MRDEQQRRNSHGQMVHSFFAMRCRTRRGGQEDGVTTCKCRRGRDGSKRILCAPCGGPAGAYRSQDDERTAGMRRRSRADVAEQPVAVVDHLAKVSSTKLLELLVDGAPGGSQRVQVKQVQEMLSQLGPFVSQPGGSAANTTRGMAAGFHVSAGLIGALGNDEWGSMFRSGMEMVGVDTTRMRDVNGPTGRCVVLVGEDGQRTMRPCLSDAVRIRASELRLEDFQGAKVAIIPGYAFYGKDLVETSCHLAKQAGCTVALDFASFEVVRDFAEELGKVLRSGNVDVVFCNEDEAKQYMKDQRENFEPFLQQVGQYVDTVALTLGEKGCLVKTKGSETFVQPASVVSKVVDTTGAGDLFEAGFLFGLLNNYAPKRCAEIGCLAGGAVVQNLGGEVIDGGWRWLHAQLYGELAQEVVRGSASVVQEELLQCYSLIHKKGRGVVYYGSARLKQDSPYWAKAMELGKQVARLLRVTTWSGGGPGMMEAATLGAAEAGYPIAGIRIQREAGTTVLSGKSYLPPEATVFCRFLSPRKVALVDAGVRQQELDRTAYIFLPGGLGTMDEFFELLTLVQLKKLGTKFAVPLILCNYNGVYDGLLQFLRSCEHHGTLNNQEISGVVICNTNEEIIHHLASFYGIDGMRS